MKEILFLEVFFSNGNIYEGEMENSLPDGKGKKFHMKTETLMKEILDKEKWQEKEFIFF